MDNIIKELNVYATHCESIKEENGQLGDIIDEKDEEIKEKDEQIKQLEIKLFQKCNEVDTHQSNLSHEHNALRGKLAKAGNTIKELESLIDSQKINNVERLKNQIIKADETIKQLKSQIEGQESRESKLTYHKIYTEEQKLNHFMKFIQTNYEWIDPKTITKSTPRAAIPFKFVLDHIHRISETDSFRPKYNLKGRFAYWPHQKDMISYLKFQQVTIYGKDNWKCDSNKTNNFVKSYNGHHKTFGDIRFDLKPRA